MFLAAHHVGLDLFLYLTYGVELAASAIEAYAIDIHGVYSCVMAGLFL